MEINKDVLLKYPISHYISYINNLLSSPVRDIDQLTAQQSALDFLLANKKSIFENSVLRKRNINKRKSEILTLVFLSNNLYENYLNLTKITNNTVNPCRPNFLVILHFIEDIIDQFQALFSSDLKNIPLTNFENFKEKAAYRKDLELLLSVLREKDIPGDLISIIKYELQFRLKDRQITHQQYQYTKKIISGLLNVDNLYKEKVIVFLITNDFNSPLLYKYLINISNEILIQESSLHGQVNLFLTIEEKISFLKGESKTRLFESKNSLIEDLKSYIMFKKKSLKDRLDIHRIELNDAKLDEDSNKILVNLSVSQFAFIIRLFVSQGILSNESLGKVFRFFAGNFRTKSTCFISSDSLQKKSTTVEFSTAKKVKGILITMINWLNENYNTSNYSG